jgi:hypothetical protein
MPFIAGGRRRTAIDGVRVDDNRRRHGRSRNRVLVAARSSRTKRMEARNAGRTRIAIDVGTALEVGPVIDVRKGTEAGTTAEDQGEVERGRTTPEDHEAIQTVQPTTGDRKNTKNYRTNAGNRVRSLPPSAAGRTSDAPRIGVRSSDGRHAEGLLIEPPP